MKNFDEMLRYILTEEDPQKLVEDILIKGYGYDKNLDTSNLTEVRLHCISHLFIEYKPAAAEGIHRYDLLNNLMYYHKVMTEEDKEDLKKTFEYKKIDLKNKIALVDDEWEDIQVIEDTDKAVLEAIKTDIEERVNREGNYQYKRGQDILRKAIKQLIGIDMDKLK